MRVGDLVIMNPTIKEYVSERGRTAGIVLGVHDPDTNPRLGLIMWPDGETENLYSDEIKVVGNNLRGDETYE